MPITRDDYGMHRVSYKEPQYVPATFKNEHWRKYFENIYFQNHADQRTYLGQYICSQWNDRHTGGEALKNLRIIYVLKETLPDYKQTKAKKVNIWNQTC
jgi:hypothetical protein